VGIDHFECSIDSSDFVTCTSPFTFPNLLEDGTHTFRVMSEDKVGNRGSPPALFNWTVDTVAPTTTIDSVADINDNPITTGGNSSSNSAVITFSGIDTGGNEGQGVGINHFECSIDGASFTNCSTPLELSELDDGAHTIEISSFDNVGNSDRSPASFIWTIDTVQPNTSITSAIDGNRNNVTAGGNTSSTSMNFAFSGTDRGSGIDHFECSIDGAPFDICASPILFSNLADGSHALEVRAEDNVVNLDSSPAFFNWTIDTSPPTTSIDSVVDNNRNSLTNNSNTRSNSITFTFSGTDAGEAEIKRFECSIDNSDFVTCTSPFGFPNLVSDGSHTFRVRAEDNSGNKDATAELFTWNVDTTPPPANIDTAIDGNNSTVPNGSNTTSTSIAFTFSGTDIGLGLDHFECSIDGASFTLCNSPVQFESLSDGTHTLEVRAEDKVGNEGPTPTAFIWTVNTKPPNTTINSVTDGNKNIVANNSNTRSNTLTITFSATDIIANVDHFECSIDDVEFVTCTSPFTFPNLLSDGLHTFRVRAEDNSGHEDASPALYTWTVDSVAPTTTIISATDGNRNTISSGGGTPSKSMIFTFSGTDTGVGLDHFECSIDGATFEACTSPAQFDNLGSGVHTVDIRAIDSVGNQGVSPAPFRWNVDATPPDTTINSATDGNNNSVNNGGNSSSTSMTFTFSGSDIGVGLDRFECSIDGSSFSACDSPVQFTSLSLGGHTLEVRAVDKVENAAETPTVFLWTITTPPPQQPPQQLPPSIPQNITTPPPQQLPQQLPPSIPQNITTPPPQQPPHQLPPSIPQNITTSPPVAANQSIVTNETTQIP
ncbi:MAG: Ig-like domain-containing protein, partial [Nitrososphaeraceae archaeon]